MNIQAKPDYLYKKIGEQTIQIDVLKENLLRVQKELEELKKSKKNKGV